MEHGESLHTLAQMLTGMLLGNNSTQIRRLVTSCPTCSTLLGEPVPQEVSLAAMQTDATLCNATRVSIA